MITIIIGKKSEQSVYFRGISFKEARKTVTPKNIGREKKVHK